MACPLPCWFCVRCTMWSNVRCSCFCLEASAIWRALANCRSHSCLGAGLPTFAQRSCWAQSVTSRGIRLRIGRDRGCDHWDDHRLLPRVTTLRRCEYAQQAALTRHRAVQLPRPRIQDQNGQRDRGRQRNKKSPIRAFHGKSPPLVTSRKLSLAIGVPSVAVFGLKLRQRSP